MGVAGEGEEVACAQYPPPSLIAMPILERKKKSHNFVVIGRRHKTRRNRIAINIEGQRRGRIKDGHETKNSHINSNEENVEKKRKIETSPEVN